MSKMKELDSIADAMADHLHEIIVDSIDWAVDGTIVSEIEGDEYTEACEAFLYGAGHRVNDCEWMVTNSKNIEYGN